jgi:serine/threonine protein kinase
MTERCPACSADVVDAGVQPGGSLRCDRCGTRFPKARARAVAGANNDPLGIHPALAKRYARVNDGQGEVNALPAAPKPQVDTRVLAGGVPSAEGFADDAGTSPGRPAARRSLEGAPAPKPAAAAPTPLSPPKPAAEPLPHIPGYEVLEMIGKGAMGRVYRARHTVSGRAAAIKTLAPELAVRPDFVQRFEREGAAMRAIDHPGVVQVWDQGCAGHDVYYIAMAFISGHPLRKYLEKGPLPVATALRFTRRILQALAAAHKPGVIHRDLKPENILMHGAVGDERPVLVDFGLAGILEEENDPHPNLTKSRMTMGTVNYMAPEQRTDAKRVDQRADIYAAGVIFYELLTGDLPLGRFALPTERGFGVPASVDAVVEKALARNADERYFSAVEFDAALAAVERELGIVTMPEHDTVVAPANETMPGRGGRHELRRDSSEPGAVGGSLGGITGLGPVTSGIGTGLPSGMSLAPAGAPATMFESIAQQAWVTMLPTVTTRWLAGGVALLVGTILGLILLRG